MLRVLSAIFGLAFGGLFAGAGIYIGMQTGVPLLHDYFEAREWKEAEARLLSVGGDDSSTTASYEYEYGGRLYRNDRVYIATFSDNIGSYHRDLKRNLVKNHRAGRTVAVYVNGVNPAEAVLDKSMRWGLFSLIFVFCSVFVVIGCVVIWAGFSSRAVRREKRLPDLTRLRQEWKEGRGIGKQSFGGFLWGKFGDNQTETDTDLNTPEESKHIGDWRRRKGWEHSRIRSDAKRSTAVMWFFALVWNGISYGVTYAVLKDWHGDDYLSLLVLFFPIVGLIILAQGFRLGFEYRKFGVVEFEMDPYPGSIGGNVGGTIQLTGRQDWKVQYIVTLECVYSYVSGSGDSRSRYERIEWAEEGRPQSGNTAAGSQLEFMFTVPPDLPEADIEQSGNYHFWRLKLKAEMAGIDLKRSYNIPVFATSVLSDSTYCDISKQAAKENEKKREIEKVAMARGRFDETPLGRSMRIERDGRELKLIFPMLRNKLLTIFALIFCIGPGFATYSIITSFSGDGLISLFAYLFAIPFGLVSLLGGIAAVYLPLNNLRVRVGKGWVSVIRSVFILPVYMRRVKKEEITSLRKKRTGSTGQGVKKVEHYKILAQLRDGSTLTVAEDIDGAALAEHFADYLLEKIRSC